MASDALYQALAVVRIAAPVLLLCVLVTVVLIRRHSSSPPTNAFLITIMTPSTHPSFLPQPHRVAILAILFLCSLTYLLTLCLLVLLAIVNNGVVQGSTVEFFGIEAASAAGFIAFAGLGIAGVWKNKTGVAIWARRRVKVFVAVGVVFDVLQLVLMGIGIKIFRGNPQVPQYPGSPNQLNLPHLIIFILILVRLALLITLLVLLHVSPSSATITPYSTVAVRDPDVKRRSHRRTTADSTTLLLSPIPPGAAPTTTTAASSLGNLSVGSIPQSQSPSSNGLVWDAISSVTSYWPFQWPAPASTASIRRHSPGRDVNGEEEHLAPIA